MLRSGSTQDTVLFWITYSGFAPVQRIERELILREKDQGSRVVGVFCNGRLPRCHAMRRRRREYFECAICNLQYCSKIEPLLDETIEISVEATDLDIRSIPASQAELRQFCVDGSDIGAAVLSTLMTNHFDMKVDPAAAKREVREFVRSGAAVHRYFDKLLRAARPDRVYLFNGRQFDSRPLMRLCQALNIEFFTYECAIRDDQFVLVRNSTPQNFSEMKREFLELLPELMHKIDVDDLQNKIQSATDIFSAQYRGRQRRGALPDGFDAKKRNITIFHSSEDEYAATETAREFRLGRDFLDSLDRILEFYRDRDEIHFYLRVHPRLAQIAGSPEAKRLMSLRHPRLTVVPPDSLVNTFDLAAESGLAVCYGSSAGLEAVVLNVPTIGIADCQYSELGIMPEPADLEAFDRLIQDPDTIKIRPDLAAAFLEYFKGRGEWFRHDVDEQTLQDPLAARVRWLQAKAIGASIPVVRTRLDYIVYRAVKTWIWMRRWLPARRRIDAVRVESANRDQWQH